MCKIGLKIGVWVLVIGVIIGITGGIGYGEDPVRILEKVDGYRGYTQPFKMDIRVVELDSSGTEGAELRFTGYMNDRQTGLLVYQYPPRDIDKVLLMIGETIWFYQTSIRQPIRMSARQRLMGNVSNADIARANFSGDYTPKLRPSVIRNGQSIVVIELIAKTNSVGYEKIVLYLTPKIYRPIYAEFYALSGKLLKTCQYTEFKTYGATEKITEIVVTDAIVLTKKTIIRYSNYGMQALPPHYFTGDFLPRVRELLR